MGDHKIVFFFISGKEPPPVFTGGFALAYAPAATLYIFAGMEWKTVIKGIQYTISSSNGGSFLVESEKTFYILVKNNGRWDCADLISLGLLQALGEAIEKQLQLRL